MAATETKERPILFSGEMVKAILARQKTQTRRVIKPQPQHWQGVYDFEDGTYAIVGEDYESHPFRCPQGQPGDRLWVMETWNTVYRDGDDPLPHGDVPVYRADEEHDEDAVWKPSIHMPRWACRILLELTDVRAQHVQDISVEDCIAEGCVNEHANTPGAEEATRFGFRKLWDSINAKRGFGWDTNCWVWAETFKLLED